jgi:hypothetical protein
MISCPPPEYTLKTDPRFSRVNLRAPLLERAPGSAQGLGVGQRDLIAVPLPAVGGAEEEREQQDRTPHAGSGRRCWCGRRALRDGDEHRGERAR